MGIVRFVRGVFLFVLVIIAVVTIVTLSIFAGFLIDKELTESYKDSPYALIGASLLVPAIVMSGGLAWAAGEGRPRRNLLGTLGASAPVLLAISILLL